MVRWIVELARSLDCVTIAEGIETQEPPDLAADAGVEKGQGYLFGRPRRSHRFREWRHGRSEPLGEVRR